MDNKFNSDFIKNHLGLLVDFKNFRDSKIHKISHSNPIFFTCLDECVFLYPLLNFPQQDIAMHFDMCLVYSGDNICMETIQYLYPKAKMILSSENHYVFKTLLFFDYVNKKDNTFIIRTCMDSVILDVEMLLEQISSKICNGKFLIGNPIYNEDKTIKYIRGGCNAYSLDLAKVMKIVNFGRLMKFDGDFFDAAKQAEATIIAHDLFSLGPPVDSNFPVCHPDKGHLFKKARYLKIIEYYVNKNFSDYPRIKQIQNLINELT